jgi:hypothetical protein
MTRQELIAKLKKIRANGVELRVKLTASTTELQAEYVRVTDLVKKEDTSNLSSIAENSKVLDSGSTQPFVTTCCCTKDSLFDWQESANDIQEFRHLLEYSWVSSYEQQTQEILTNSNLLNFAKQTVERIAKLSRDWCMRECRGFMSIFGQFVKLTTRTPRRVARRAKRFIVDICKASMGMLHSLYTRVF